MWRNFPPYRLRDRRIRSQNRETIDTYNHLYDERFDQKYETLLKYDAKDIYCTPIVSGDGIIVGVLQLLNRSRPFTPEDYDFLRKVAEEIGPVLQNHSAE